MTTFALDTATPDPALAILGDEGVIAEAWLGRAPGGGRRVLEATHHLLAMADMTPGDLDEIVVGIGPGGFTGIRIGIATAMGLGQALGIPVHGACTLEALALGAAVARRDDDHLVVPVIDARRRQVFAAAYRVHDGGVLDEVLAPAAWDPHDLAAAIAPLGTGVMAGDGAHLVPASDGMRHAPAGQLDRIQPAQLVARVRAAGPRPAAPMYLRLPDAEENRLRREREGAPA